MNRQIFSYLLGAASASILAAIFIWFTPRKSEERENSHIIQASTKSSAHSQHKRKTDAGSARDGHPGGQNSSGPLPSEMDQIPSPEELSSASERQAMMREQMEMSIAGRFESLFGTMGLSEQQKSEVVSTMATQQLELMELLRPRRGEMPPPLAQVEQLRNQHKKNFRSILGEENYQLYMQHQRDGYASRILSQLQERAQSSGVAYSPDQLEALNAAFARERPDPLDFSSLPPLKPPTDADGTQVAAEMLPRIQQEGNTAMDEARQILSPEQFKLLESVIMQPPGRNPRRR